MAAAISRIVTCKRKRQATRVTRRKQFGSKADMGQYWRAATFPALDRAEALYERFLMSVSRTPVKVPVMKATVQSRVQNIVPSH